MSKCVWEDGVRSLQAFAQSEVQHLQDGRIGPPHLPRPAFPLFLQSRSCPVFPSLPSLCSSSHSCPALCLLLRLPAQPPPSPSGELFMLSCSSSSKLCLGFVFRLFINVLILFTRYLLELPHISLQFLEILACVSRASSVVAFPPDGPCLPVSSCALRLCCF